MDSSEQHTPETPIPEPINAPGRCEIPLDGREDAESVSGSNTYISWGARSDVGLVREHNEDSFLLRTPLFAICDGMGGHAAGEVASSIAVNVIADKAPSTTDDVRLGAAIEAANQEIIDAPAKGIGKPGMGSTASAILIEGNRMAVAHVGDSRIYLLHHGTLVRITHDHSYVEELVDSGQITADEARTHPSRSVVTRALGSDPDMYADHFSLEISDGDRIILCSDGLSGMVPDDEIESIAVSNVTPQKAADNLVSAALTYGGSDNVTVIVVDVLDDGIADKTRRHFTHGMIATFIAFICLFAATIAVFFLFISSEWYLGVNGSTVGVYRGIPTSIAGINMSTLVETTSIEIKDLPDAVQDSLAEGIRVKNESEAQNTVDSYRKQIDSANDKAVQKQEDAQSGGASAGDTANSTTSETGGE